MSSRALKVPKGASHAKKGKWIQTVHSKIAAVIDPNGLPRVAAADAVDPVVAAAVAVASAVVAAAAAVVVAAVAAVAVAADAVDPAVAAAVVVVAKNSVLNS